MMFLRALILALTTLSIPFVLGMDNDNSSWQKERRYLTVLYLQSKFYRAVQYHLAVYETKGLVSHHHAQARKALDSKFYTELTVDKKRFVEGHMAMEELNNKKTSLAEHEKFFSAELPQFQSDYINGPCNSMFAMSLTGDNKSIEYLVFMLRNMPLFHKHILSNTDLKIIEEAMTSSDNELKKLGKALYYKYLEYCLQDEQKSSGPKMLKMGPRLDTFFSRLSSDPMFQKEFESFKQMWDQFLNYISKVTPSTSEWDANDQHYMSKMKEFISAYQQKTFYFEAIYKKILTSLEERVKKNRSLYKLGAKKLEDKQEKSLPSELKMLHLPDELPTYEKLLAQTHYKNVEALDKAEIYESFKSQYEQKVNKKSDQPRKKKSKKIKKQVSSHVELPTSEIIESKSSLTTPSKPKASPQQFQENNAYIEITDPGLNTRYIFYKVIPQPISLPNFSWHDRVNDWFEDANQALTTQCYFNPQHHNYTPVQYHNNVIARHRFPKIVDTLLPQLAIKIDNPGNDRVILFGIPGEIYHEGKRDHVIFTYAIDTKNNCCYHRCATTKTPDELLAYALKGRYEVDFPPLS